MAEKHNQRAIVRFSGALTASPVLRPVRLDIMKQADIGEIFGELLRFAIVVGFFLPVMT